MGECVQRRATMIARFLTISVCIILLFAASSYSKIDLKNIVSVWLFDEGQGNTAKDFSGYNRDGKLQGGAKWVEGKFGKALELNGKDAWVDVPTIGTFDEVTITAWVNMTGRVNDWRVIFNNNGWKVGDVHHQLFPDNRVEFSIHSNPGGNDQFGTFKFDESQLNKWHHLATAYSAKEKKIRFYVDGKLDVESPWGGNSAVLGPARIGSWDGGGREWQGILDEVILFKIVLAEEDIHTLMEEGLGQIQSVDPYSKVAQLWGNIKTLPQ